MKYSVLVADDNFDDQQLIKEVIHKIEPRSEVLSMYNGNQVVDYVLKKGPYSDRQNWPSLIILDLNMPFLDGYGVLEILNEHPVTIPTFVFTSMNSKRNASRCLKLGVKGYYQKPNEATEFKDVVQKMIKQAGIGTR